MNGVRSALRNRRGYSLVELLVAMAILGMLGSALAQIMMGQQRFFQRTTEQTSVRRELRTALSILPTELRGVSSAGGDILDFSASTLTFRSTIGASLVCARSSATSIDIPPLATARTITTSWYAAPVAGDTVFALRNDSSGVRGDYWTAHRITAVANSTGYCAGSPYTHATLDAGKARFRYTVTPALPDSVVAGSALRFTRIGRYALERVSSGRWYLTRSEVLGGAWSTAVPVSGPFMPLGLRGSGGIAIALYDSTGAAVTSPAQASRVARFDILLRAQGQSSSGTLGGSSTAVIDSVAMRIAVRNRR